MRFLITVCCIFLSFATMAEEIVYDMSVWGYTFGKMVVTHTMENDSTELYTLKATGAVSFLWMKKEGYTNYEVRFRNGKMLSSTYIRKVNGETEYWNNVQYDGEKYLVESNLGNRHFTEVPEHSVLALYFKPITEHTRIYCEAETEFSTISEKQNNRFKLACTDGSHTIYHLEQGAINEIEVHASMATIRMTRVKD